MPKATVTIKRTNVSVNRGVSSVAGKSGAVILELQDINGLQGALDNLPQSGEIIDADISESAAISLSKLAINPLARDNHTGSQLASTISDFDTQVRASRLDQLAVPTSSLNLNNQRITQVASPASSTDAVTRAYADSLVVGLLNDRGNYDASPNTFPISGGSGTAGAIRKGDLWIISVAGTLGGIVVTIGDVIRALINTPGQTSSNWAIAENNFGYVPLNQAIADGQIYIGNSFGIGTAVTLSGDLTISNSGVATIGAGKITNSMLSGGIQDAKILSATTWNAKEPPIASGTTSQFWRGDKTWQTVIVPSVAATTSILKGDGSGNVIGASASDILSGAAATTVGANLLTLTNPSAVSFLKVAADNTVSTRTPAQVLSDIGGIDGTALNASNLSSGSIPDARNTVSNGTTTALTAVNTLGRTSGGGLTINWTFGSSIVFVDSLGNFRAYIDGNGFGLTGANRLFFTSVGLSQNATSGVLEVNSGTATAYRDVKLRNLTATGLVNLLGATSGTTALQASDAVSPTITLPATTGTLALAGANADITSMTGVTSISNASLAITTGTAGIHLGASAARVKDSTDGGVALRNNADSGYTHLYVSTLFGLPSFSLNQGNDKSLRLTNAGGVGFISGTDVSTLNPDTTISRISAGLLGIGTTTYGSFAGSLKLTNLIAAGATSGATTLSASDAVSPTITLPATTGTLATLGANTFSGHQLFSADNIYDIGASGGTRPRNIFAANNIETNGSGFIGVHSAAGFTAPSTGVITLINYAGNDFIRLQFGGTTSSFPALKRSSATLQARLADDSAFTNFGVASLLVNGATSGATTLSASDAVSPTITLPATTGTLALAGANADITSMTAVTSVSSSSSLVLGNGLATAISYRGRGHSFCYDSTEVWQISSTTLALIPTGGAFDIGTSAKPIGALYTAGIIKAGAQVRLKGYTVATLPSGTQGDTAFVTDALTPAFGSTIVGGGAVVQEVFYNGTNWIAS